MKAVEEEEAIIHGGAGVKPPLLNYAYGQENP